MMSEDAFNAALASGKYSKQWLTAKMTKMQDHEKYMAFWDWLKEDEESKYYLGMVLGSSTAVLGAMISGNIKDVIPGADTKGGPERDPSWPVWGPGETKTPAQLQALAQELGEQGYPSGVMAGWFAVGGVFKFVPPGYVLYNGDVVTEEQAQEDIRTQMERMDFLGFGGIAEALKEATDMVGVFKNLFSMAGLGFAGACTLILMCKAIFGDQGLNSLSAEVL